MTRLVNDLLTLAHVGNSPLEITDIDLSALCEDVVASLRHTPAHVPTMVASIDSGLTCRGDAVLVRTVLENLLGNAWKYSSRVEFPRVEVGATKSDGRVTFHVKDNGVGFDMKDADMLFAPFERLHKATDFEGTGVGLAAVQRIIERHGGRIWADSAPGKGATFFFTLG
jgi:signal transduction histidine kinase